jgi:phage protein D
MIVQVRAARPSITLDGQDYYKALAPYLLTFSYTDNCDGKKGDDLSIELADRDKRFINDWMPKKGAFIDAGIVAERWFMPYASDLELDCGRFWIDSIEFELP